MFSVRNFFSLRSSRFLFWYFTTFEFVFHKLVCQGSSSNLISVELRSLFKLIKVSVLIQRIVWSKIHNNFWMIFSKNQGSYPDEGKRIFLICHFRFFEIFHKHIFNSVETVLKLKLFRQQLRLESVYWRRISRIYQETSQCHNVSWQLCKNKQCSADKQSVVESK